VITTGDIEDAARRLAPVIRATPTARSGSLSAACGRPVLCKPEHLQRTGSFKIRGAYNRISRLAEERPSAAVVAASAGNHAQGVALAARLSGLAATIFMPANASLPKLSATRSYGADVVTIAGSVEDCIAEARAFATENEAVYVPPFDDPLVIAGQGTIGLEIAAEAPRADVVVVPVGGGGLIAGVATAIHDRLGSARVIGVEASGATAMLEATRAGAPVLLDSVTTMADGIAVRRVSELTLAHVTAYVDEIVTVDEEEISRAMLFLLERSKWVVEPAGAVGVAALLAGKVPGTGSAVAVISGGNVDALLLTRLVGHGLAAAGRYLTLRIVLPDRPGALAALTAAVAELDLNVLAVDHHRSGTHLDLDEVEVLLTLETRDPEHRDAIVNILADQGFRASILT